MGGALSRSEPSDRSPVQRPGGREYRHSSHDDLLRGWRGAPELSGIQSQCASDPDPGPARRERPLQPGHGLYVAWAIHRLLDQAGTGGGGAGHLYRHRIARSHRRSLRPTWLHHGRGIDVCHQRPQTTVEGSSFAAAMVAGAAALVKQANPGFSAAQIKSALVNTASIDANDIADNSNSGELLITSVGAGKLNAAAALAPGATVVPSTVSFGWVGPGSAPTPVALTVTNTGKSTATFKISFAPDSSAPRSEERRVGKE